MPRLDAQQRDRLNAALGETAEVDQIGPYRILERVGEGGMGIVYRAEQRTPIRREVALKVIKLGMDTKEVIARFEAERQALAMMDHPNVARVLEAGATVTGRPYFVMEYVAGEPLTVYCDRHKLTLRSRLELFRDVCDAVQHAHQKGIIHRDLKPSNILVALRDGKVAVPKVIDFGVAKATAQRLTERTLFTETGQMIGTPEYMSPEQAEMTAGGDADTRSDIFSLGVVLYELLTGALPLDPKTLRGAGYHEIQRMIREVDPPRPSTRLSGLGDEHASQIAKRRGAPLASLRAQLRHELEWIPLKAMRKDRTERYRAASELGDDVGNYLAGRPLLAAPETTSYRVRKFLRRHRGAVVAASVVLLALSIGVVATSFQALRASRAERRALREKDLAERRFNEVRELANRFMFDFYSKIENLPGATSAVQMLVQTSREYLNRLANESSDPDLLLELGTAYRRVGDIQGNPNRSNHLGDYDGALDSYRQASTLFRHLIDAHGATSRRLASLALAESCTADLLLLQRDRTGALEHFREAEQLLRRSIQLDPARTDTPRELAMTVAKMGDAMAQGGDTDGALSRYEDARRLMIAGANACDAVAPAGPAPPQKSPIDRFEPDPTTSPRESRRDLMALRNRVADVYRGRGSYPEALREYRAAQSVAEHLLAERPQDSQAREDVCVSHSRVAATLLRLGDYKGARLSAEAMRDKAEQWSNEDRDNVQARRTLCMALELLGEAQMNDADPRGALETYRRCKEVYRTIAASDPGNADAASGIATAALNHATVLRRLGQLREARDSLITAVAELDAFVGAHPQADKTRARLSICLQQLGGIQSAIGEHDVALQSQLRSLHIDRDRLQTDPANTEIRHFVAVDLGWVGEAHMNLAESTRDPLQRHQSFELAKHSLHESVQMLIDFKQGHSSQPPGADDRLLAELRGYIERCDSALASVTPTSRPAPSAAERSTKY